ncbi:MAG TPA: hypothetical protein VEQ85_06555 [Lacipirellulaceae bacterium]|nr:hypothetical protein [Lacipirellulaceae bacterium]
MRPALLLVIILPREEARVESRGTAVVFFLVLGIVCTGAYWAYDALRGGGQLLSFGGTEEIHPVLSATPTATESPTVTPLPASAIPTPRFDPPTPAIVTPEPPTPTSLPPIGVATQPPLPTLPPDSTAAPSATPTPTFTPEPTRTPTPSASPTPSPSPTPTRTLTPSATPTPSTTPTPSATPLPTATPTPTPIPPSPTPVFPFQLAQQRPDFERGCSGHYIFGYVRDAAGTPLAGVLIHAYDQYGNDLGFVATKEAPDLGYYNFPISSARDVWTVEVVSAGGAPLSPPVQVLNTGAFIPGQEACWHQVDWVRR